MPELPEVHTTVEGIKKVALGKTIQSVWSDFHLNTSHGERQTIKNKKYFEDFKKIVTGTKIISVERKGKNILIHLNNKHTIVIHMKMTGHVMYGVTDKFVHFLFKLRNAKDLVLSDMRKFASVTIFKSVDLDLGLGIDALDRKLNAKILENLIKYRGKNPIKNTLLDQALIAGIGNIYSDEILFEVGIHPLSESNEIPDKKFPEIFKVMQKILLFSIKHGGDSKSDYRNVYGEKGGFQNFHKVYGHKGKNCLKKNCRGIIERIVVKGRSSHFCPKHQIRYER